MIEQARTEPTADLRTIKLEKILSGDAEAAKELLQAAHSPGFFYLNTRGQSPRDLSLDAAPVSELFYKYFAQSSDVKKSHGRANMERGYKYAPGYESIEVALDEMSDPKLAFPGTLLSDAERLTAFAKQSDSVARTLVQSLSSSLGTEERQRLIQTHLDGQSDTSGLKVTSAPTKAHRKDHPDTTHTDGGSLTLLWGDHLSSQILDPRTNQWSWCEPREGCALVNVADSLQRQTGDLLHSCVHRVLQPNDGEAPRLFLSYLLRPSDL